MIYNNLSNKILLLFNEQDYTGGSYVVKELFFYGCPTNKIVASGEIVDNQISLQLKDGMYNIEIVKDNLPDFKDCFPVFYNELPNVLEKIQEAVCPCKSCKDKADLDIANTVFYTLGFMQTIGKVCDNNLFTSFINSVYQEIKNKGIEKKFYGKVQFDYNGAYKDLLIRAYILLYKESTYTLTDNDEEKSLIDAVYNYEYMRTCLYSLGYDVEDIICGLISDCGC